MIWFISACLFLLFDHYASDFSGILLLGISLPILIFRRQNHPQTHRYPFSEPFLLYYLILSLILGTVLGAMPQEILNLMGLSFFCYLLFREFPRYEMNISLVLMGVFSWMIVWIVDGKYSELVVIALYFCLVSAANPFFRIFSFLIHAFALILTLFLKPNPEIIPKILVESGNQSFHYYQAIVLLGLSMNLVSYLLALYYKPRDLFGKSLILVFFHLLIAFFMNPIFSVFLYFSSLQVMMHSEKVVARGDNFAS